MPNRVTKGRALVGAESIRGGGKVLGVLQNTVARTDTVAKTLFTLPRNATLIALTIFGAAASNAGTSATISVGQLGGTGTEYVNALDVKGVTGSGQQVPAASNLGAVGASDIVVTGIYAETGAASTTGGPWTVTAIYAA